MSKRSDTKPANPPTRFSDILRDSSSPVSAIAKELRRLIYTELPKSSERFVGGRRPLAMYRTSADICWIQPQLRWCNCYFARGTELSDPHKLLVGTSERFRYVRISSLAELRQLPISQWLRESEELNAASIEAGISFDDTMKMLRAFCLSLPKTKETLTWGIPHFRVGEKIFCGCSEDRGSPRIGLKMERVQSESMMKLPGISKAPYSREGDGWVTVDPNEQNDWEELERWILGSYRLIAPKRIVALLAQNE